MCGGGGNVVENLYEDAEDVVKDVIDNPLEQLINIPTQVGTGGLIGFEDGKFEKGTTLDILGQGFKDISGISAAEEATEESRRQFEETKNRELEGRKERQAQSAREQLRLSRQAGSVSRGGIKTGRTGGGSRFSSLGSDEQDFLGL